MDEKGLLDSLAKFVKESVFPSPHKGTGEFILNAIQRKVNIILDYHCQFD